jgi:hypothetical protein
VGIIKEKGPDYLIFKKDLKKAYRQIPICPGDLHLVEFKSFTLFSTDSSNPQSFNKFSKISKAS